MSEEAQRKALYASFKNRGMMYYHIFEELRKEVGEEKATEIMKRAIYNRGLEIGKRFAQYAPADMEGIKNAFLAFIPDEGRMFEPEIIRCDSGGVDIKMQGCPLKAAWQEAGLSDEVIAKMCDIAGSVDLGTFEGAGLQISMETWSPGKEGCCQIHIRPSK